MNLGRFVTFLTILLLPRIEYFCKILLPLVVVDLIIQTHKGKCYLLVVHFFLLSSSIVILSVEPHWHNIYIITKYAFLCFFVQFVKKTEYIFFHFK